MATASYKFLDSVHYFTLYRSPYTKHHSFEGQIGIYATDPAEFESWELEAMRDKPIRPHDTNADGKIYYIMTHRYGTSLEQFVWLTKEEAVFLKPLLWLTKEEVAALNSKSAN